MANVSIPPPSQSDWSRFDHESHPGINRIFQKDEQMGVRRKEVCGVKCSQQLSFLAPGENLCDAQLQVLLCRLVSLSGRVLMSLQAFGYICTWGQTCLCTYQLHEAINSFLFPFNKKVLNKYFPLKKIIIPFLLKLKLSFCHWSVKKSPEQDFPYILWQVWKEIQIFCLKVFM